MRKTFKKYRGITLIEMLVVIAIVAALAVALVFVLRMDRQISRDAKRVSDVKQIQAALEMHFNDENVYPSELTEGGTIQGATGGIVYMLSVPGDPLGAKGYGYKYVSQSPFLNYAITFQLERGIDGLTKGIHTATTEGIQ